MGILSWLKGASKAASGQVTPVVQVSFRDLGERVSSDDFDGFAYAFTWPFAERPEVGLWAIAEGMDGPTTVVVRALGVPDHARDMELKPLLRLVPDAEVQRARAALEAPVRIWLDQARHAAGMPVEGSVPAATPSGFDPLPPTSGSADAGTAERFAGTWWRAYKKADELGREPEEVATFEKIALSWYRERDRAAKAEESVRIRSLATSVDLDAAIRGVDQRSRREIEAMEFAGEPLWDWLKYAQDLDRDGHPDEALSLVLALVRCAEQESRLSGREPAPAYTERAAIMYRKRKDYASEVAIIERWEHACPPERRGPGSTQGKLASRLKRARELAAKAS